MIAERFREAVERFDWITEDPRLAEKPREVDVGIVCLLLERRRRAATHRQQLAHELLDRADKLMYEAKGERARSYLPAQRPHRKRVACGAGRASGLTQA